MIFALSHLPAGARALMLSQGVARFYPGIIATGDVRRGRDTKLVVARNRWFESISLQPSSGESNELRTHPSSGRAVPLPHLLHVEVYGTYPAGATFSLSRRT